MDDAKEVRFWKHYLALSDRNFLKSYFKNFSSSRITYKGGFGHGTCNVVVRKSELFEKIIMSIKVVKDAFSGA